MVNNRSDIIHARIDNSTDYNSTGTKSAKEGYLAKNRSWKEADSTKLKERISVQGVKIALNPSVSGNLSKIKNYLTTIKFQDSTGKSLNVNINSLSKRTHTSVFNLLKNNLFSGISSEFVNKQIDKMDKKTNDIIVKEATKQIVASKGDKTMAVGELAQAVNTFKNSNATVLHTHIQNTDFVLEKKAGHVTVITPSTEVLGTGGFGKVTAMKDVFSKQVGWVQKTAIGETKRHLDSAERQIENENIVSTAIHKGEHKTGVQDPPLVVNSMTIRGKEGAVTKKGYIARSYDFDLDSPKYKKKSFNEKMKGCYELAQGLDTVHTAGYVHGDIKEANCCYQKGECQLADFGDARHESKIVGDNRPIGTHTEFYMHPGDEKIVKENGGTLPHGTAFDFGKKHDVHCLGLVYLSVLSGVSIQDACQTVIDTGSIMGETISIEKAREIAIDQLLRVVGKESPEAGRLIRDMLKPQDSRIESAAVLNRMKMLNRQ